ncbi:MAG: hypothetical protein JSV62_05280 [Promethearchaeota archaeon]|nr:MAG: hypothetical protein JSV62_05280 [Candidatus Lokiarchaeota archaeon]
MTNYALMFEARPGGEIIPIKWSKDSFMPETSIIVLDEGSESVYLWHGVQQGLVARRTALRQAESLKGHGYTVGKSIIGRDIKYIIEIDARKVGKVPEDTKMNDNLQEILDRKYTELDNFIVTFQAGVAKPVAAVKTVPKVEAKPAPSPSVSKPVEPVTTPAVSKPVSPVQVKEAGSEYDVAEPMPSIKTETKPTPSIKVSASDLVTDAKIAFVFSAILEHYDDIWISKKPDGSFSVEQMDGPIATFSIKGSKLNFTANSFSGVNPGVKTAIQKKFIELNKLLE